MSVTIKQRFVHMSPRKLRFVANLVRGKNPQVAEAQLLVLPKVAAKPIHMAVKAALSAAKQKQLEGNLVISSIYIDEGPAMKRRILRSRGRASRMEHRMSHITVTVDAQSTEPKASVKKPKSERKEA